jgi:phosphate transport system permease protein
VVTFLVNSAARLIVARSAPGGKRPRKIRRIGDKPAQTEGVTP